MKHTLCAFALLLPLIIGAQKGGIKFETGVSWEEVKEKARVENKYIFVDCYATWCKPCKVMDMDVYPNDTVGGFMNSKFISIKLQMDSTKKDAEYVRLLYPTARWVEKEYVINSLPTYLFFGPDGNIVHKDVGSKKMREFLSLVTEVLIPEKQIYTIVNNCLQGEMHYQSMPAIAKKLSDKNERALALKVASAYMHTYLDTLSDEAFFTKRNFQFLQNYVRAITSSDRAFKMYYHRPDEVDAVMNEKGHAKSQVNFIISREEIQPTIDEANKTGKSPDWKRVQQIIRKKYNKDYALTNILNAKINWNWTKKEKNKYCEALMQKWKIDSDEFERYGWLSLNGLAWNVAVYSDNKKQLNVALKWADLGISKTEKPETAIMDTKANILYKLGRKKEAIALESQIVQIYREKLATATSENDKKQFEQYVEGFQKWVDKMKTGKPIQLED